MAWHKGTDLNGGGGHFIAESGAGDLHSPDCPACKYGTLDSGETDGIMVCIDCGAVYSIKQLVELHVLPND